MLNTENEGLVLSGFMAEHSDVMEKILNISVDFQGHDKKMALLENQLDRIEKSVFTIMNYETPNPQNI